MKSIETSIIIQSSVKVIWDTLMDFNDYPNWNPFITSISGNPTPDTTIEVTLSIENQKPTTMKPKVVELEKNNVFCWEGHLFIKGLFDGRHQFILIPLENGDTKFIQSETFKGILVTPIMKLIGEKTINGFNQMNLALKQKVEASEKLNKAS